MLLIVERDGNGILTFFNSKQTKVVTMDMVKIRTFFFMILLFLLIVLLSWIFFSSNPTVLAIAENLRMATLILIHKNT